MANEHHTDCGCPHGAQCESGISCRLKPCPFCGGAAEFERLGTGRVSCIVVCEDCGARHESGDSGAASGESWNRRHPRPLEDADLDAIDAALASPASKTWLVTADKPVLPTPDDDGTETWVWTEVQARDMATAAHHDGATETTIECHVVMRFDDVAGLLAEARLLRSERARMAAAQPPPPTESASEAARRLYRGVFTCATCDGTGRELIDCDGSAGYRPCPKGCPRP